MTTGRSPFHPIALLLFLTILLVVAPERAALQTPAGTASAPTLLTNAWLIDGTGAPAVEGGWLLVEGDRITGMGQGTPPAAAGAQVIDLQGRTVLPGLADMHTHLGTLPQARWMAKLMLAQGITNIKETGNSLGNLAAIRQWLASDPLTPHVYMSGYSMQGDLPNMRFLRAGNEARRMLEDNYTFGVQFFKAYNWTSSQALKQMGDFAKAHGVVLTGHIPLGLTSVQAIDSGMQVLEHVRLRPGEVIDDPEVLARFPIDLSVTRRENFWAYFKPAGVAVGNTVEALARRKDKFFLDSTIVVNWAIAHTDGPADKALTPYLDVMSPAMLAKWRQGSARGGESGASKLTAEEYAEAKRAIPGLVAFVGLAHKRGVRLLSGTDTPVEWVIPGHSLHQELAFFVEAGMTPVEAIRSSTGYAAEAFRSSDRGTLAKGKIADLVIVRGNVATDIRSLDHIEKVMLGGKLHDQSALLKEAARWGAEQAQTQD